jgi:preprotein translocase subunit Sec63
MASKEPITHFGLRPATRFTTSVDANGKGVFTKADQGDFEATMGDGRVARFDLFQANQVPVNMNDDADIKYSAANQVTNTPSFFWCTGCSKTQRTAIIDRFSSARLTRTQRRGFSHDGFRT